MEDLKCLRDEIDKVDKELVQLIEKRIELITKVGDYKKKNNIPILNTNREKQVIEKAYNNLNNKEYIDDVTNILINIMNLSKNRQNLNMIKEDNSNPINDYVGFQGVTGAFSDEALVKIFGKNQKKKNYNEFEDVFKAINNNEIKYGVLPIENSSTGIISKVYDLLCKYDFHIVKETYVKIEQNLLGIKGAKIDDIKVIYSHQQGFEQSSEFLSYYPDITLIPYHNTAVSAKHVSELNDISNGAIASKYASELYNLDIIKPLINNQDGNYTRFIVVSKELEKNNDSDKISIMFQLKDEVGTLYDVLSHIVKNNINMNKIESRPIKNRPWHYSFYIDFDGNLNDNSINEFLSYIKENVVSFKLLGSYKNEMKEN